jgi:hypothetical protein
LHGSAAGRILAQHRSHLGVIGIGQIRNGLDAKGETLGRVEQGDGLASAKGA